MPKKPKPLDKIDRDTLVVVEMNRTDPNQVLHLSIECDAVSGRAALCGAGEYDHVCRFLSANDVLLQKERRLCAGCRRLVKE